MKERDSNILPVSGKQQNEVLYNPNYSSNMGTESDFEF